jgi:hypothetical protein
MSGCNRVVSQCEMAGASGCNNAPTAGAFRVGRREARSLSERKLGLSQKDGLPTRCWHVIDCGSRPSTRAGGAAGRCPLTLAGVVVVMVVGGGADPGNIETNTARSGERVEAY